MQPVKIRILSSDDTQSQATEQKYTGTMTEKNGKYYVMYKEDEQSGLDNTKTTLKWDVEQVVVMRSGSVDHRQEFRCGYIDKSIYHTPYLKIPLITETTYLYTYFRDGVWHLEMKYTLYHEAEPYGKMKILIEIEEDTQVGH